MRKTLRMTASSKDDIKFKVNKSFYELDSEVMFRKTFLYYLISFLIQSSDLWATFLLHFSFAICLRSERIGDRVAGILKHHVNSLHQSEVSIQVKWTNQRPVLRTYLLYSLHWRPDSDHEHKSFSHLWSSNLKQTRQSRFYHLYSGSKRWTLNALDKKLTDTHWLTLLELLWSQNISLKIKPFSSLFGRMASAKIAHWAMLERFWTKTSFSRLLRSEMMTAVNRLIIVIVPKRIRDTRTNIAKVLLVLSSPNEM